MGPQQGIDLIIGDDGTPELTLRSHRWPSALPPYGPQQKQINAPEPFRQFFEDCGHGLGEPLVVPGPRALELRLFIDHAKHLSAEVLDDLRVCPSLSEQGAVAVLWRPVLLSAVIVRVRILASSTDGCAVFSALKASLSSARTRGIPGFDTACRRALQNERFDRSGGDLLCVAEVVTASTAAAVTGFNVVHLVRVQGGILGGIRVEVVPDDDGSVNGEGTRTERLKGSRCDFPAVHLSAIGHGDTP